MELLNLNTESRNANSMHLDQMSTMEMLYNINDEDKKIANAVEKVLPQIGVAIDNIYYALAKGGRLLYVGAGTSGRLGILDASECPPTFMTKPDMVQTIMAGGNNAFFTAIEGSEDKSFLGEDNLKEHGVTENDVVVGITASGRTPYTIGALRYASKVGAYTVSISSNEDSEISKYAECSIEVLVGPEVLTGSTRMKSGTSHKMILNMMSTITMVKLGKVYENLMVDLNVSNHKLMERAKYIIMEATNTVYEEAERTLLKTNNEVKPAIVMIETGATYEVVKNAIEVNNGYVRDAIKFIKENNC